MEHVFQYGFQLYIRSFLIVFYLLVLFDFHTAALKPCFDFPFFTTRR